MGLELVFLFNVASTFIYIWIDFQIYFTFNFEYFLLIYLLTNNLLNHSSLYFYLF